MDYINKTIDYWLKGESTYAKTLAYYPEHYAPTTQRRDDDEPHDHQRHPVGHFVTGYDKAIRVGFKAIKEEARAEAGGAYRAGFTRQHRQPV